MAVVHPFQALRPTPEAASAVAAVPYDVVSTDEARALAAGNPLSFLHVSRAEIDLPPGADPYSDEVYRRAAENLELLTRAAPLLLEAEPALYLYRLRAGSHEQTGLAGCYSLDEYDRDLIKRHERTRRDKEDDRTRHMLAVGAQTGIVFLAYRATDEIDEVTHHAVRQDPLFDVAAPDGVRHTVWRLDRSDQAAMITGFGHLPALYIADGHHRIASASRARDELEAATADDPGTTARTFLGVAFPDSETRILAYNRTVETLVGLTSERLLEEISARFSVRRGVAATPPKGQVAMYLAGTWYGIDLAAARHPDIGSSESPRLDVAVLQDQIVAPVLKVTDVRTDPRMTFVGGARGTQALEQAVDSGRAAVAFSLAPVTPRELLAISDAGDIVPPKSTWFEPKLRDGLLIQLIQPRR